MQIANVSPTELHECAEVIRHSFATVAREFRLTRENCPTHTSFMTAARLRGEFDNGALMFALREGDAIIGFVALKPQGSSFELSHLAVLPEHRHNGYGLHLLNHCKTTAQKLGGRTITIGIINESAVLKDWYIANGFTHTETQKFAHLPFTVGFMEAQVYVAVRETPCGQ